MWIPRTRYMFTCRRAISMELSLSVLATWNCRDQDLNTQPSPWYQLNPLTYTAEVPTLSNHTLKCSSRTFNENVSYPLFLFGFIVFLNKRNTLVKKLNSKFIYRLMLNRQTDGCIFKELDNGRFRYRPQFRNKEEILLLVPLYSVFCRVL